MIALKARYAAVVAAILFGSAMLFAQTPVPQTPTLKLNLPPHGAPDWDTYANQNFLKMDALQPQWRGNWATGTPYNISQIILYSGSSYISISSNNVGHQPDTSPSFWQVLAGVGGIVVNQTSGVIPLATGSAVIGAKSHLDDGNTTPGTITSTEPFTGTSASFAGAVTAAQFYGSLNGNATSATTAGSAAHALNLPADFATQSSASPNTGTFSTVSTGQSLTSTTPLVNVQFFGAKIDGSTDDTAALSAAYAVAAPLGGTLYMAAGTMNVTATPAITSGIKMQGAGKALSVINLTGSTPQLAGLSILGTATTPVSNVEISNLTIRAQQNSNGVGWGIRLFSAQHIYIHDVVVDGGGWGAVSGAVGQMGWQTVDDVLVERVRFQNDVANGAGLNGYLSQFAGGASTQVRFRDIDFAGAGSTLALSGFNCQFCEITDSHINQGNFDYPPYTSGGYGAMYYTTINMFMSLLPGGCTGTTTVVCTIPLHAGDNYTMLPLKSLFRVRLDGVGGGTGNFSGYWDATRVSSTQFSITAPGLSAVGILLGGTFTGTLTSGSNVITGVGSTAGLAIGQTLSGVSGIGVANTITAINPGVSVTMLVPATASLTEDITGYATADQTCSHNLIANNFIENTGGAGIYLQTSPFSVISGNRLQNTVQQELPVSLPAAGIAINGGTDITITGNKINLSQQSGIEIASTSAISITGNVIDNITTAGIRVRGSVTGYAISGNTISNIAQGIYLSGNNVGGAIGANVILNPSYAGILTTGTDTDNNFSGPLTIRATGTSVPCVYETGARNSYGNTECTNSFFLLQGSTYTTLHDTKVFSLATGAAYRILSATHTHIDSAQTDTVQQAMLLSYGGVDPSDIWVENSHFANLTSSGIFETNSSPITGDLSNGSSTVANVSPVGGLHVGEFLTSADGFIQTGTTITAIVNSGSCPAGCSLTLSLPATGTQAGDTITSYQTASNNVHLINVDIQGTGAVAGQALYCYACQNWEIKNLYTNGFSQTVNGALNFSGATNGVSVRNSTINGGLYAVQVGQPARNIVMDSNNIIAPVAGGGHTIVDQGTGAGNIYTNNVLTGGAVIMTNPSSVFSRTSEISGTGAPSSGLCTNLTPNLKYAQTDATAGANEWWCNPATSLWVQQIGLGNSTVVPAWLRQLGDGSDGANLTASGNLTGDLYYTNFTLPFGNTVTVNNNQGLTIHATGACVVAGQINARGADVAAATAACGGGGGGGGGGGTLVGVAGVNTSVVCTGQVTRISAATGGTAGTSAGGTGGAASTVTTSLQRSVLSSGGGADGRGLSGGPGGVGGSSGPAIGNGGNGVVFICNSFTGTDGTNTGAIDVSGGTGGNSTGNNVGSSGGGGAGVVIISSRSAIATPPTITTSGGAGGTCGAFTGCGAAGAGGAGWSKIYTGW